MMNNKNLQNNSWKNRALAVHKLISIEIANKFYFYTPNQKKIFKRSLALIDKLDLYLEDLNKYAFLYHKTLCLLFKLLKKLHMKLLVKTIIANKYGKECEFLKF